eukprot:1985176-Amphidinium_carterae.1
MQGVARSLFGKLRSYKCEETQVGGGEGGKDPMTVNLALSLSSYHTFSMMQSLKRASAMNIELGRACIDCSCKIRAYPLLVIDNLCRLQGLAIQQKYIVSFWVSVLEK